MVGDEAISGGVGFVESIFRKLFNVIENRSCSFGIDVVGFLAPFDKPAALLGHDLRFFLAHGAAEDISLAEREAGQSLCRLLNLFLIDNDAIGFFQDGLQKRVVEDDLFVAMFALDKVGDELHRPRTVEREDGNDILDTVGGNLTQGVAHAAGFKLEDADGVAAGQHLEGLGIIDQ